MKGWPQGIRENHVLAQTCRDTRATTLHSGIMLIASSTPSLLPTHPSGEDADAERVLEKQIGIGK